MNTATNLIDDLRILEAPRPWYHWAILATAIVLAGCLFWFLKRRVSRSAQEAGTVALHPHEDALAALEKARALMSTSNSRAYAMEVSAIVRRYIEHRFGILAPRRSTEEFLQEARVSPKLERKYQLLLEEFLKGCDFLKFARGIAETPELENLHQSAMHFVSQTKAPPESLSSVAPSSDKEVTV
jgi:hypothetical protein